MMILDAHAHLFPSEDAGRKAMRDFSPTGYWGMPQDLLELMKKGGISLAVTAGTLPVRNMIDAEEGRIPMECLPEKRREARAKLATKMGERLERLNYFLCEESKKQGQFIPFVAVNPWIDQKRMLEILEHARALGARGLKLHPPLCRFYPADERLAPIYAWAVEGGVPILFHGGRSPESPEVHYSHPRCFEPLAKAHPRLRIVIAHLGWDFFDDSIQVSRSYENIYFDTSFILSAHYSIQPLTDSDAVDLIRRIGTHKVFFGSDYPWSNPLEDAQRMQTIGLKDPELEQVLGKNALECFCMDSSV